MGTLHHINLKPVGSYALPMIPKTERVPTCTTDEDDVDEVVDFSI